MMSDKDADEVLCNLKAPHLGPELIDSKIKGVDYSVFGVLTVCVMTLENGFNVLGTSAPVSSENFNPELGKKIAYEKAREKIWELEGYLLKQKLYEKEL